MRTGVKGQGKSKEKVSGRGIVMDEGNSDERVREGVWRRMSCRARGG
jgi:hypothetical protein